MSDFAALADYLPHDPPMVLLDSVIAKHDGEVTCALQIREGAPFVDAGRVRAVVALEYMAQAAGVYAGIESRAQREPIRWGFLIGCSELVLTTDAFVVGTQLIVAAKRVWGDARLGQFDCWVDLQHEDRRERVASATLNVARADSREIPT